MSQFITSTPDLLTWVAGVKDARKHYNDLCVPAKCIPLAKRLLENELVDLVFTQYPVPAKEDAKEPDTAKMVAIKPSLSATAFRLCFGWGKESITKVLQIEEGEGDKKQIKHYASFGDPFTVYPLDGFTRGQWAPWPTTIDIMLVKWAADGLSVERSIIAHKDYPGQWNCGAFGSDLIEYKSFEGGRLCLRLVEPDEQFVENWIHKMTLDGIPKVIEMVSKNDGGRTTSVAAAGPAPAAKEEAAEPK